MLKLKTGLIIGLVAGSSVTNYAQPLPSFSVNRRADSVYMAGLAHLARQRYASLSLNPSTTQRDTARLETLVYLAHLYRWWFSRRDSILYYADLLVHQAHKQQNLLYEIKGKSLQESYYHSGYRNTLKAFKLNFEIMSVAPPKPLYGTLRFQALLNLSNLYSISRDYATARQYLHQAQAITREKMLVSDQPIMSAFRVDVEQQLGSIYKLEGKFTESEKHYLAAEELQKNSLLKSESGQAFIYDDLGELYLQDKRYQLALLYAKKAEAIWDRIKTKNESHSWGTLACVYAGLGQDDLAARYAQKVLHLPNPNKFIREQAYASLYQVYEHQQDWKNTALYYKKYIAVRDTITMDQRSIELAAMQKKVEYDRLALINREEHQLRLQQVMVMHQQAELDKIQAGAKAEIAIRQSRLSEQRRQFDQEVARKALFIQKMDQQKLQQAFDNQLLVSKNRSQQNWIVFSSLSSVLLLGVVLLLLYSARLRKQKARIDLRLANERREANLKIIQAQEEERQRIAADLHDDLGGTLATLRRRLYDLRSYLPTHQALQEFDNLQPLLQKSSADLRRIAHNLMPPEFERIGLRPALEQLVNSQPHQPTSFHFFSSGIERSLPLNIGLNVYRIVSELIQNIVKHAQAQRAAIQLLYHPDRLTITIEDDGLGNRVLPGESVGIGLKTSNLRAEYIGATLARDASEAGTFVVLDIPYPSPFYAPQPPITN